MITKCIFEAKQFGILNKVAAVTNVGWLSGCQFLSEFCFKWESLIACFLSIGRQKLTSPKWNPFKGIRLRWKEKIRLNNVIWRCWHMQCKYQMIWRTRQTNKHRSPLWSQRAKLDLQSSSKLLKHPKVSEMIWRNQRVITAANDKKYFNNKLRVPCFRLKRSINLNFYLVPRRIDLWPFLLRKKVSTSNVMRKTVVLTGPIVRQIRWGLIKRAVWKRDMNNLEPTHKAALSFK